MEFLAALFVMKPLNILVVALILLAVYLTARLTVKENAGRRTRLLLIAAIAWGLYAGWEWLVLTRTPDANIRVDLLVLWPVLGLLALIATIRVLRP